MRKLHVRIRRNDSEEIGQFRPRMGELMKMDQSLGADVNNETGDDA